MPVTKNIVTDYGAVGTAEWAQTLLNITAGTAILHASDPIWAIGDIGKGILLPASPFGNVQIFTIAGFTSATQITLSGNSTVTFTDYDAIVAWGTDDTAAFQDFKDDYQGQSGVVLTIPPGIYLIMSGNFTGMWDGITNITVNATGATLAGGAFQVQASAQYQFSGHTGYVASVSAGSSSVTLLTLADASKFVVGNWAMMTGFDMQMSGYPTNNGIFEYHKIASIVGAVVTFETPLAYDYLSTWPLYQDEILPPSFPNQRYGGPATLYAMDPKFEHTSVVNGLTIAQQNQYGVSGMDLTFNDCVFEGVGQIGPHPTMAKHIKFNNCTLLGGNLEVDKLVQLVELNGGTWKVLIYQSGNSIRETILDNTTITESVVGTSHKFTVRNGTVINFFGLAPPFFGYTREFNVSDSVIETWAGATGNLGLSIRCFDGGPQDGVTTDGTMVGGVLTIPAAYRLLSPSQWAIAGESLWLIDTALGTMGALTILDVADATPFGDLIITTDWPGGWPATHPSGLLWMNTHPSVSCTVTNSTGCIEIEELSLAPPGKPLGSYYKRTFDGSVPGQNSPSGNITGTLKYIKVTVTTAYTGIASTFRVTVFPGWGIDPTNYGVANNLQFLVNLRTTGTRILDLTGSPSYPVNWTGAVAGDTLPAQTKDYWLGGNFFIVISDADISGESPAVWPQFTIEAITDQGLAEEEEVVVDEPIDLVPRALWVDFVSQPALLLDGLSPTGAWSASRKLLTAYGGAYYNLTSGFVDTLYDQSGNTRNFTQSNPAGRPPILATGPNSRDSINFDGSLFRLDSVAISNFITASAGYIVVSFIPDNTSSNFGGNIYAETPVFADNAAYMGAFVKLGNIQNYNYDGSADYTTAQAISTGTPYVFEWRHEGGTLYQRINGASEVSVASGNTAALTGLLFLTTNYVNAKLDCKIFEMATFSTVPGATVRDALVANMMSWVGAV
jgi:hypothetical protein